MKKLVLMISIVAAILFSFNCLVLAADSKPANQKTAKTQKEEQNSINTPKPTFENIAYGPYERNILDFWKTKSDKPTALVLMETPAKERVDMLDFFFKYLKGEKL